MIQLSIDLLRVLLVYYMLKMHEIFVNVNNKIHTNRNSVVSIMWILYAYVCIPTALVITYHIYTTCITYYLACFCF